MALDLEAIELIKQLKARYFRAIDTADFDLLRTCFQDDSTVLFDGGTYKLDLKGLDAVIEFLQKAFNKNVAASHLGHHPEITVSGDTAVGMWYLHDMFYDVELGIKRTGSALYSDEYVKVGDRWVIKHSGYKRIWERLERFSEKDTFTYRQLAETGLEAQGPALTDDKLK